MRHLISFFGILLLAFVAHSVSGVSVDDSDLTGPVKVRMQEVNLELQPDLVKLIEESKANVLELRLIYERQGELIPISGLKMDVARQSIVTDENGHVKFTCKGDVNVIAELKNEKFSLQSRSGRQIYKLKFPARCDGVYEVRFNEKSQVGEAISIFETMSIAKEKLDSALGKDIWTKILPVRWPSNGDYYSWGTLHLTVGYQWDVVGHELGHAIYDMGQLGAWGGGPHKIDECYSLGLALSEGWASFFAAWLYVELDDTDAKFQYLVPRRAPIRIEHVPEDVCNEPTNEWRVTSFFWDLVDFNDDGEISDAEFALTWNALEKSRTPSILHAKELLQKKGIPAEHIQQAWQKNFGN